MQDYTDFLFPKRDVSKVCEENRARLASVVTSIVPSLWAGVHVTASPVSMACIPIIVPMSGPLTFDAESVILTEEAKAYVKGLLFASAAQASFGVCDALLGDMTRAMIKILMAGLGYYATRPEGLSSLSSFSVVSFLSGSINGLAALQMISSTRGPLFSGLLPLVIDYIRFSDLAHPLICFASSYFAWMLLKELRRASAALGPAEVSNITGSAVRRRVPMPSSAFQPFQGAGHSLGAN